MKTYENELNGWWEYEKSVSRRALNEINRWSFVRGLIFTMLTLFGRFALGLQSGHDAGLDVLIAIGVGVVVLGGEFLFKLFRASARMSTNLESQVQEKGKIIQKQSARIKTLEDEIEERNKVGRQEFRNVVEQEIHNLKRSNPTPQDFLNNRILILRPAIERVNPFVRDLARLEKLWLEFNALDKRARTDFNMGLADFSAQINQLENTDEDWAKIKTCLEGFVGTL